MGGGGGHSHPSFGGFHLNVCIITALITIVDPPKKLHNFGMGIKPILHYALGLRSGKVCDQKRKQKRNRNAFYPTHIEQFFCAFLALGNFLAFFLFFFLRFHSCF